jgi:hypothetical protein
MTVEPQGGCRHLRGLLSPLGPLGQAVLLGGTGFVAGYIFPLWRMPYANQGPLMGFFITGPLGFFVGLVLGFLGKGLRWRLGTAVLVLVACCSLFSVAIYLACEPEDRWVAQIVDGTIVKCSPPIEFVDEVLTRWEKSIAINPQKIVATSWREDVRHTLSSASGYVATFRVERTRDIYIGRKASNRDATNSRGIGIPKGLAGLGLPINAHLTRTSSLCRRSSRLTSRPYLRAGSSFPEGPSRSNVVGGGSQRNLPLNLLLSTPTSTSTMTAQPPALRNTRTS